MDSVISGVRTEYVEHTGIVVTDGSDMELLSPAFLMVHTCEVEQDCAAELEHFLMARLLSLEGVAEDLVDLLEFEVFCIEVLETMV